MSAFSISLLSRRARNTITENKITHTITAPTNTIKAGGSLGSCRILQTVIEGQRIDWHGRVVQFLCCRQCIVTSRFFLTTVNSARRQNQHQAADQLDFAHSEKFDG